MKGYGGLWGLALAGRAIARLPVSRGLATSSCAKHQAPSMGQIPTKAGHTILNNRNPHIWWTGTIFLVPIRRFRAIAMSYYRCKKNGEMWYQVSARDIIPCWSAQSSLWLHIEELRPCRFALQASKPYIWAILYSCWTCSLDSRLFQSIAGLCQGFLGCQPQTTM